MRPVLAVLAPLALAACFDAEMTLDFIDAETVEISAMTTMSRELYDMGAMSGSDPCEGGEGKVTASEYTCVQTSTGSIDEIVATGTGPIGMEDFELGEGLTLTRDGDNIVVVSFDLDAMTDTNDPDDPLADLDDAMAAAFVGHSVIYRIRGYKILSTTGDLSEDGTEAEIVIPIPSLATGDLPVESPFVTEVQLAKDCAFLGLFCD